MRAALFVTCINDALYPSTAIATVKLLERLGVQVTFPFAQTCCGQPQFNTGYRTATEPLLKRMIDAFDDADHVVTPSGSCAAMVRDNYPRIAAKASAEGRDSGLEAGARSLAARTYELTEFLTDVLGVVDVGAHFPHTVTYHPSCHGLRTLGLGERPRRLLEEVKELRLAELPGAEECCGFGGTFAVKNADVSAAMGQDKITNALSTGADFLCGADNSCLMHLDGLLRRQEAPLRPLHLAEILASTVDDPWSPR
ncbi:(Fe-S)-binding protein [Streptomyces sp. BE20]|uniref:(Fe-S)-binding protein n=1 Tax=unclassified Streptomyces TaxID=2593676 RepID=UPI002E7781EE|nr:MULTISPECIES: (Fe-S)-binding protein [unclassified Streptomyces]MED7949002.1 (Fe-S)-binding protein [Streptomyces sp. BE303]MEE1820671.1 (Fe-S)-binding protein [Streptomyces sp. BE20]